jgi:tetratricopeptide (TPR) repeat protein
MNSIKKYNDIGMNFSRNLKLAKRFYRKNRLHDALSVLLKLKHHGYEYPEVILLIAKVYDRLFYLTSEADYEVLAVDTYNEIIRYSPSRRYIRKAVKLQKNFFRRLSALNENEYRAQTKAEEFRYNTPQSPKAWYMLGANFPVRKDPYFVINAFSNALKLNDKYISALYRIGYIYQYNLNDSRSALGYYLKAIKIPPYQDNIESESTNVKIILEACCEIGGLYTAEEKYKKVISVFDHAFKIYMAYTDICSLQSIKKLLNDAYIASVKLGKLPAFEKHIMTNYGYELDMMLDEVGIV